MSRPVIAIVIARGGSVRLPRKNAKVFCGHPLVAWSIVQSKGARHVDHVVLSTDDDEIEEIGRAYGVDQVIRRPDWPDADQVGANRPYLHAIHELKKTWGLDWDMATPLPTSPTRKPDDIDRGIELYQKAHTKVVSLARKRECFIYKEMRGGYCRLVLGDKSEKHFESAAGIIVANDPQWYIWYVGGMESDHDVDLNKLIIHPEDNPDAMHVVLEVEPWQAVETDTAEEFEFAELVMEHFILKGRSIDIYKDYWRMAQ